MSDHPDTITITASTATPAKTHVATPFKTISASVRPKPFVAVCMVAATALVPAPDSSRERIDAALLSAMAPVRRIRLLLPTVGSFRIDTNVRPSAAKPSADLFATEVTNLLRTVEHVDGAFLGPVTDSTVTVFVLAKEHGLVDRDALLDLEDQLSAARRLTVILTVRAHQGRDLRSLSGGADLLFSRG